MKKMISLLLFLILISPVYSQKRAFTLDDIYRVKSVGSPLLSPDGNQIIYSVSQFDMKKGSSQTSLFIMDSNGDNKLKLNPEGEAWYSPVFSPDAKFLYFISYKDGNSTLYKYEFDSKTVSVVTSFFMGVNDPVISPDGKKIAFTSKVYPECGENDDCNKENFESFGEGPIHAHMSDKLFFRHWTEYEDDLYSHIFLLDLNDNKISDITPGEFHSPIFMLGGGVGFNFSADSKNLVFASNREKDQVTTTNSDLWMIDLQGKNLKNLTQPNKAWDGHPIFSPDGKYLAYRMQTVPGYESDKFRIALYELSSGIIKVISDAFDNWVTDIIWAPDSKSIYFTGEVQSVNPLFRIDINTLKIEEIISKKYVGGFTLSPDGKTVFYNYRLNHLPAEIYSLDLASGTHKQLTFENKQITEEVDFRPVEHHWVDGANGKKVDVLLVKPHGFDPNKKYPLIVNIHGGPQSQWADAFRGDNQLYAGYGYVFAMPNPHGSTGYGQEYTAAISGDYTGKVVEDIHKVTDYLESLPYIDKERVGAMGWSFGGYMVNWLQATTTRYKCFASMMGLYNLKSFYGTTEELWFPEWDLKGTPWNSALYTVDSPSEHVKKFATPTLIVTGERDYRVSYNQSLEYFTALQKMGVDSRIIVFDNDGHWPSHTKSMPLYYNAHLEWFHKYLGGEKAPYDSKKMVRNKY